jgi:hypothetical protein
MKIEPAPNPSPATSTDDVSGVASAAPCSALAGARYRSSYVDGGKKTWTPWKTVGDHWGIAHNHFSELSECWTKDTEWDFSGSHDLVWNELRGYVCFECGIPLPPPPGQKQPPTARNTHRGRLISEPNKVTDTGLRVATIDLVSALSLSSAIAAFVGAEGGSAPQ